MASNLKKTGLNSILEEILDCEGGETLDRVNQGSCVLHIPGSSQGQVGPMEGVPAHGRSIGTK